MLRTLIVLTAVFVAPMLAQDELPDLPGKATTVKICTACHGPEMWATEHKSSADWDQIITLMTEKGLAISDDDYTTVLGYLSKAFAPLPLKLNINKASSGDIQKTLAITAKQADAIVAYRAKNGDFKDLDSVKKVDGVDASAIDASKDRIIF
jgi:competence protein ComEA